MKDEGIFSKAELTGILSTNQIEIVCFRQYLWEESLTHFDFLESTTPILKKHIDTLSGSSHWIISDSVWFDWVLDWVFLIARVRICFARAQTCFTYQVVAHLFVFRTVTATFALTSFLTIVATFSWSNSENVFFSVWVFFQEHSRITGLQRKGEGIWFPSASRWPLSYAPLLRPVIVWYRSDGFRLLVRLTLM